MNFYTVTDDDLAPIVRTGHETPYLDYKAAGDWRAWNRADKAELVRDMMALANSDMPGYVVIGVSELPDKTFCFDGVSEEQAGSFDASSIADSVREFADPEVRFLIRKPHVDGRLYVVVRVAPFEAVPHICRRNSGDVLQQAAVYIRSEGAQTIKVPSAEYMRRLTDRATQNSADAILSMVRRLVTHARPSPDETRSAFQAQIDEALRGPRGQQ